MRSEEARSCSCTPGFSAAGSASASSKAPAAEAPAPRSEEHTSELQSPCNLVCRLLLEKKRPQYAEGRQQSHRPSRYKKPHPRDPATANDPRPSGVWSTPQKTHRAPHTTTL